MLDQVPARIGNQLVSNQNTTMAEDTKTAPETTEPKPRPNYTWGVGRRKSAVARVRIAPGSGKIEINGRTLNDYFTAERDRKMIFGPLEVTSTGGKMEIGRAHV